MQIELVGPLIAGILASAAISISRRRVLPKISSLVQRIIDQATDFLPRTLRPLEQTLLCLGVSTLTWLIVTRPESSLWGFMTAPVAIQNANTLTMIAAAAALLALLTFAATLVRSAEKDASIGETYLGQRLATYLITRSRITQLLWLPGFYVMTVLLFVIPVVQSVLPRSWDASVFGVELTNTVDPKLVGIALWCACFVIVGGVLLLNILSALRSSTVGLLQPPLLKAMVRDEIRHDSEKIITSLFRTADSSPEQFTFEWVRDQLDFTEQLPEAEGKTYFAGTVAYRNFAAPYEKQLEPIRRKLRNDKRRASSALPEADRSRGTKADVKRWFVTRRANQAKEKLLVMQNVQLGWLRAMLSKLSETAVPETLREHIVKQCIQSAKHNEAQLYQLRALRSWGSEELIDTILLRPNNKLQGHLSGQIYEPDLSLVEYIPALTYAGIANSLFPRDFKNKSSNASGIDLRAVITAADLIGDPETRFFALQQVLKSIIKSTIVARSEFEPLGRSTLAGLVGSQASRTSREPSSDVYEHKRLTSWEIAKECAFWALIENPSMDPKSSACLLDFIDGWRLRGVFLYLLFYGHRSGKSLEPIDIRPFHDAFRNQRGATYESTDGNRDSIVEFLARSHVGHFVRPGGVEWLLSALDRSMSVTLCEEFELKRQSHEIVDFELVQLVQWWVAANTFVWHEFGLESTLCPGSKLNFSGSAESIRGFAAEWFEVNSSVAFQLERLADLLQDEGDPSKNNFSH